MLSTYRKRDHRPPIKFFFPIINTWEMHKVIRSSMTSFSVTDNKEPTYLLSALKHRLLVGQSNLSNYTEIIAIDNVGIPTMSSSLHWRFLSSKRATPHE